MVAEPVLWVLGIIFLVLFEHKGIGVIFVFISYFIHCGLFLRGGRDDYKKLDTLVFVWQSMALIGVLAGVVVHLAIGLFNTNAEAMKGMTETIGGNTESIGRLIGIIEEIQKENKSEQATPRKPSD